MKKELFKEGGGHIFESCDISLKNTHTSHAVILALFVVILQCLICHALAYAVPTNNSMKCGIHNWGYFERKALTFATTTFNK